MSWGFKSIWPDKNYDKLFEIDLLPNPDPTPNSDNFKVLIRRGTNDRRHNWETDPAICKTIEDAMEVVKKHVIRRKDKEYWPADKSSEMLADECGWTEWRDIEKPN